MVPLTSVRPVTVPVVPLSVKSVLSRLETASPKVSRHVRPPVALVLPLELVVWRATAVTVGAEVSSVYGCEYTVPSPPLLLTLTLSELLPPLSVALVRLQIVLPWAAVAVDQVDPPSVDTRTDSPAARGADSEPLTVCDAVLVMKSVMLLPVSLEMATDEMVVVGLVTGA